ncbi:MAG: double-strand break repair helicase AddA [Xanthobacteraceae bacterium]|nr:double-strand break repair helicase AddA [Xanthobacteraceae bacterium]
MSAPRAIPPTVTARQIEASDPHHSAFVAANAGSGKTHVLAQRVIRLLLSGVDPARILCITFTKAAAANMANRVFDELRKWTRLDDPDLDRAMQAAGVALPTAALRQRARRLFALALETPGGLKVQTIHAFCTQLLHLFPFEANVAARFEVLDEPTEAQMLEELSLGVMLQAAAEPDSPLGQALAAAVLAAADVTFRELVRETIRRRDALVPWVETAGGVPQAMRQLSQALGIQPEESMREIDAMFFNDSVISASEWPAIAAALKEGSTTDKDQGARFAALGKLSGTDRLATYFDIFCTDKQERKRTRLATKAIQISEPQLCARLTREQDRVWALIQHRRTIETRDRSVALFTIAHAVIERFRAEKNRRGLLDYQDLIDKTLELLNNVSAAWVHYKLDRGIHHVLVDEAQDTSPKQWAIIKALTGEFFTGLGAHDRPRTVFAVGDEKQSIFSFQGAVPTEFANNRDHFARAHRDAAMKFVFAEFKHSFRSGPNVLEAVDAVFKPAAARAGLTAGGDAPVHEALPGAGPGLVEIWELEKSDEVEARKGWAAPLDKQTVTSGTVRLARRIAGSVAVWRAQGRLARDVLILVRRRGALFEAIIRALKNLGIPVAGADRLMLTEHIAVMDLMTLADALLLPEDDLALATVLKSPLFGLDDDDLFSLSWKRKGSLLAALRTQRPDITQELERIGQAARNQTPFTFYAGLLGARGLRRKILMRLGHEAADALDEFLNLALDYERRETPSLQGFVAWLRDAQAEVKRDMELARDEVRVMTVHGAKGLEAPIVILADTTTPAEGWHPPRLLPLPATDAAPGPIVWATSKIKDTGPMTAAREIVLDGARDEYRRLLYVAMTRAIDRLVVCGIDTIRKVPAGCWYKLVRDALEPLCVKEKADHGSAEVWRYRKTPERAAGVEQGELDLIPTVALPSWLTRIAETTIERPITIKPSGFVDDPVTAEPVARSQARERAIARGLAIHRLMQSLPDVPPDRRAGTAALFLARQKKLDDTECRSIAQQVQSVLSDPRFAALFGPGSRAEVSITGRLNGHPVAGQVDRLVVTANEVLIADYKSNRPPPQSLGEALEKYGNYLKQLALYRDVLTRLYPGRPVRAALLWTETPELMEIPPKALDEALGIAVTGL